MLYMFHEFEQHVSRKVRTAAKRRVDHGVKNRREVHESGKRVTTGTSNGFSICWPSAVQPGTESVSRCEWHTRRSVPEWRPETQMLRA